MNWSFEKIDYSLLSRLYTPNSKTIEGQMKKLSLILSIVFLLSGYVYAENRSADGRYIDLGNGAIKDTKTGLMWRKR